MYKFLPFLLAAFLVACDTNAPRPVASNSAQPVANAPSERPQTAIAHTTENQPPPASDASKSKWSQGGEAFDTSVLDKDIAAAEKAVAGKATDEKAKKALSEAYYKRAVALTDKRQYASALGDYRRAVKYDPSNAEAKDWIDKIIMIYGSLNKAAPNEGEEPPPLPFEKGK